MPRVASHVLSVFFSVGGNTFCRCVLRSDAYKMLMGAGVFREKIFFEIEECFGLPTSPTKSNFNFGKRKSHNGLRFPRAKSHLHNEQHQHYPFCYNKVSSTPLLKPLYLFPLPILPLSYQLTPAYLFQEKNKSIQ